MIINTKKPVSIILAVIVIAPIVFAAAMIGTNYMISGPLMSAAGGTGSSVSYQVAATVGQGVSGQATSASFSTNSGSSAQQLAVVNPAPNLNLANAFVYPNPYKPGSGGQFDAASLTFSKLTDIATIKIYTYAGQLVTTLNKTDTSVDFYQWNTKNESGELVSSGVYIYLITNSNGQKAKGKFGIIR